MFITGDYHVHTSASDGRGCVVDKAKAAERLGLQTIAIADHGPASIIFHQTERKFARQHKEIEEVCARGTARALQSVEANILNEDGSLDVSSEMIEHCDLLHIGFHRLVHPRFVRKASRYFLLNGWGSLAARQNEDLVRINTMAAVEAMRRYPVDVLCHPCHRAILDMKKVCAVAEELGVYIELNEKHIDAMEECIDTVLNSNVKFILGSDAHVTEKVGNFPKVIKFIKQHGISYLRVVGLEAEPVFRDKRKNQ